MASNSHLSSGLINTFLGLKNVPLIDDLTFEGLALNSIHRTVRVQLHTRIRVFLLLLILAFQTIIAEQAQSLSYRSMAFSIQ